MFDPQRDVPIDLQIHGTWPSRSAMVHDVSFASTITGRASAYLVAPRMVGPYAGAILQHGMPGSREHLLEYAVDLAPTGLVSLLIDAPFARRIRANPGSMPITFTDQDYDEQAQTVVDMRRGVDLLVAHPQVDPHRLAYIGRSYGAMLGGIVAGVERRFKLYILACGDGGLVRHFTGPGPHAGPFHQLPDEQQARWCGLMEPLEATNFVGKATPAMLYFQGGRYDSIVSPKETEAYYAAASTPKRLDWYDAEHALNRQALYDRVSCLEAHVGIASDRFRLSVDPEVDARQRARNVSARDLQDLMRAIREGLR